MSLVGLTPYKGLKRNYMFYIIQPHFTVYCQLAQSQCNHHIKLVCFQVTLYKPNNIYLQYLKYTQGLAIHVIIRILSTAKILLLLYELYMVYCSC